MKYRIACLAAIFAAITIPASALEVVYDGCPGTKHGPVPETVPVVVKCNGNQIYSSTMTPGASFKIAGDPSCHYIVDYKRSPQNPTYGSLGVDCSGKQLSDKVVRFQQTYKGCLCQYEKSR